MASEDIVKQLRAALDECARLREENRRLRALLGIPEEKPNKCPSVAGSFSLEEGVTIFRGLFRGRKDVYPVRWENRKGRSGYSPACANEWNRPLCEKPRIRCADCENRALLPVTDEVIYGHLTGKHTIGVYPLLPDETCWFLAVDFDKATWKDDVGAFLKTCEEMVVPAVLERSRSGHGGHVWIFFESPIQAALARKLGSAILTSTMEKHRHIGLDSYDRFFPNQDTMPKGGFGNLIALPQQRGPSEKGNTLFLDWKFKPYPDQWAYLCTVKKMKQEEIETIVYEAQRKGKILGVRMSLTDEGSEDPWTLPPSGKRQEKVEIEGQFPEKLRIVIGNMVYIEKKGLPFAMVNRLIRLSAFQNPEFYKAQAMRLSTFGKPRIISCAEEFGRYIGLPRGSLNEVLELLKAHNIKVDIKDERFSGVPIEVDFKGELQPLQKKAASELLKHDIGILSAPTAFGKTVIAAYLIAKRRVNTLVLVHRRLLMDQWYERLRMFLNMKCIGRIGGGRDESTGYIDVGMIQSIHRKGVVRDIVAEYGQIIVDECHHISAFSFEQVLKQVKARYLAGLTATPVRKDGHHPIIMMQCGPIRFRGDARRQARERPFEHVVIPRYTDFRMSEEAGDGIQPIYTALTKDSRRNDLIFNDLLKALDEGRAPLVLTERTEHLEAFAQRLRGFAENVIVLRGGMGKKKLETLTKQLEAIPDGKERVLIATGRYIGEGFDDARLDTLFLAMPISWRGTIQQYAGRLHRLHANKKVVQIYDYVDAQVAVLLRMYERRLKGYSAIGYSVQENKKSNSPF
ncbi:type III restriction enzyme, res subunit [bacterium BMS3Abin08]|nr:type III restriction enzyme, res subunit [bacterium BMS3Abin08]